jgi:uncharacterized membrane protein
MPERPLFLRAPQHYLLAPERYVRLLQSQTHLGSVYGDDWFGQLAERMARFCGTPTYIAAQTFVVICWIIFNGFEIFVHFDKYPFILLNLAFSTQAAYAAPLILLAQTRQAERDKVHAAADAQHREELAQASIDRQTIAEKQNEQIANLLEQNTRLTEETKKLTERVDQLTRDIHAHVVREKG